VIGAVPKLNGSKLSDRRGTRKAEIPEVSEKGVPLGSDPLAIYRPAPTKTVNAGRAMANFHSWTYAAVNAIASEVANIQLRLFRVQGNEHVELDDHEILTLLEGVNEMMTGIELKYTMMSHLELIGNFYALQDGVSSETSKPRPIYTLNPGNVTVKINKATFPYKLSHYEYAIDGKLYRFEPYQVLHIRYPDPNDPFIGIGVPQTIPSWIDSDKGNIDRVASRWPRNTMARSSSRGSGCMLKAFKFCVLPLEPRFPPALQTSPTR
jgi:Phage portal protein